MISEAVNTIQHSISIGFSAPEAEWAGLFDKIEVWRSRDASGGPYEELTASDWTTARQPPGADDPPPAPVFGLLSNVSGKQLDLLYRERDEISIIFTGADPLSYQNIADQITAGGRRLVRGYVTTDNVLVIETYAVGTTSVFRVLSSDAASILGLPSDTTGAQVFGRNPRISLIHGKEEYQFIDGYGADTYWYKIRFRNSTQGTTSEFTAPFQVGAGTLVSTSNTITGYVDIADLQGRAIANREVIVGDGPTPHLVDGVVTIGIKQSAFTDADGRAEFTLIRGKQVTIAIVGTGVAKDILPPVDQNIGTFNMLDPTYSVQNDYFKVRAPNIPFASRRSI